jgi:RNA polymerase sigma factor (sigma-70 family)
MIAVMSQTSGPLVAGTRPRLDTPEEFAAETRVYSTAMYWLARRLAPRDAAEDIVQDALVRAWRHRSSYDPSRGSVSAWLFAIVANEARRTHRRPALSLPWSANQSSALSDDVLDIRAAVGRLPKRQRLALDCFYYAGLSVEETAAVMKVSVGTVKSTLSDARTSLRRMLDGSS